MRSSLPLSIRTVLALAFLPSAAFAASGLGEIDRADQERLSRGCLVAGQLGGAAAYRRCVARAVERLDERDPAAALVFEERLVLRRRCGSANPQAAEACVRDELDALDGTRQPFLGSLDADERRVLVQRCIDAPPSEGVASYRRCLDDGLDALDELPSADLSPLALEERAALARRCDTGTDGAPAYRRCLLEAIGVPFDAAPPPATSRAETLPADTVAPDAPVANDVGGGAIDPAFADAPGTLADLDLDLDLDLGLDPDTASASGPDTVPRGTAPPPDEGLADELERLSLDARARLESSIASLDGTDRLLLLAAFALPFLLLIVRTAIRGGARARQSGAAAVTAAPAASEATLAERVSPASRGHEPPVPPRPHDDGGHAHVVDTPFEDDPAPSRFVPRCRFGQWLVDEKPTLRRQHAIEFLVYWMAYGDERYDVQSRRTLLERDDVEALDPHERIKRHVLERDTSAFADALLWLQRNTDAVERVQVLDLLMALLVADRAMTPVQNTLLRFTADAFGVPAETLNERHEFAFDAPLPPLPRPDLPTWWENVEPGLPVRWNARALATLEEHEQHRVRLGLPLDRKIAERRVIESFRRAARRCRPGRFDALGERERALVERQLARYEEARDALLGGVTA